MQYLVLRQFRTFGKTLRKGDVVDESEIRSPLLRMSEGKIIPAVSSSPYPAAPEESERPVEKEAEDTQVQQVADGVTNTAATKAAKPQLHFTLPKK